jgi:hypothetical protein
MHIFEKQNSTLVKFQKYNRITHSETLIGRGRGSDFGHSLVMRAFFFSVNFEHK